MQCSICLTPLDSVWAEIGETRHSWCVEGAECSHGETRGSSHCGLCRYKSSLMKKSFAY